MIQIDREGRKIEFLLRYEHGRDQVLPNRILDLVTGYVCPKCSRIIRAYFENPGERFEVFPYEEVSRGSRLFTDFFTKRAEGGGIVSVDHRIGVRSPCGLTIYTHMSAEANARALAREFGMRDEPWLARALYGMDVPGIKRIEDVCERDVPLLGLDEDAIKPRFGDVIGESYMSFSKREAGWGAAWAAELMARAEAAGVKEVDP